MLLALGVPSALAIHDYTDVPDSNPFHSDISAIKGAGITGGKTCVPPGVPPTFCPSEDITREAMAAFVHRGNGRSSLSTTNEVSVGDDPVELASLSIDVGGVAGQTQFVKLDAAVTAYIDDGTGCPCETAFVIWSDDLDAPVSTFHYLLNDDVLAPSGFGDASGAATAVVTVPTATTQTFSVLAFRNDPTPSAGDVVAYASMSAVSASFGSTGTDVLGTATVQGDRATGKGAAGRLP
jgi:hypothetical protein